MSLMAIYKKCQALPLGKKLFSKLVCFKAPYFNSVRPVVQKLAPNHCEVTIKKRRAVCNHLATVHAIAMCNMAELAAGLMTDASLPSNKRWIPKAMEVKYLKKAKTDLLAVAKGDRIDWQTEGDVLVPVVVLDQNQETVFTADILMNLKMK